MERRCKKNWRKRLGTVLVNRQRKEKSKNRSKYEEKDDMIRGVSLKVLSQNENERIFFYDNFTEVCNYFTFSIFPYP